MVILQRSEMSRMRILHFLTIALAAVFLIGLIFGLFNRSETRPLFSVILAIITMIAVVLTFIQLYAHRGRSQVLLLHRDAEIVLATNALHEGFKLRFLRDVLNESVFSLSDDERARWKSLEADGFYATLHVRNVPRPKMIRLCTMIFDDVFVADRNERWEHYDSANTSEPSYTKREMPRLKHWKGISNISA